MKIISLTDLHAKTSVIPLLADKLKTAQLVILCGDITHFGHEREMSSIIQQFRNHNPDILAVTGNCDYPAAEKYLVDENLAINARVKESAEYQFIGLSGSLPCPGRTPQEYSDEEFEAILDNLSLVQGKPLILISHQPPFGTLNDQVSPGYHVGSRSVRLFIEKHQPLICFTGHIHEGIAVDRIGETTVVNPGPAGAGNYAVTEIEGKSVKNIQLRNLFHEKAI
jgi:uncharacterized protein